MTLLAVFGAGASADAVPRTIPNFATAYRPVVTDELFLGVEAQAMVNEVPESVSAIRLMRESVTKSHGVEAALSDWLQEVSPTGPGATPSRLRRRQVMATRFYLHERLRRASDWLFNVAHETNYVATVQRIERWQEKTGERVLYVTFNYDTLLDDALRTTSLLDLGDLKGYIADRDTALVKVHGSVNWWHSVDLTIPAGAIDTERRRLVIRDATAGLIDPSFEYGDTISAFPEGAYIPALAVPVTTKVSFECPALHERRMQEDLKHVDRMLIVGWRGLDVHFAELLAANVKALARLEIVTRTEATARGVAAELKKQGLKLPSAAAFHGGGFSEFVDQPLWTTLAT